MRLVVAERTVTVQLYGKDVFLDPGIWVASLGSALEFHVRRARYTAPITVTQVIRQRNGAVRVRRLPRWVLDGWNGLRDFIRMQVRSSAGKVVARRVISFCPNTFDPERAVPGGASTWPYPQGCSSDPFAKGIVWGIARGWAADPAEQSGSQVRLALGTYRVTAVITRRFRHLLGITAGDATASVRMKVVKGSGCCLSGPGRRRPRPGALPALPSTAALRHPPRSALPDLIPLPSWGISTSHTRSGEDLLSFGATVWVGGNSPLDVEGFRSNGSPVMKAYQYYYRDGRLIGRTRAGTMGFDRRRGHNHWHFEQFAAYRLLDSSRQVAVRSHKQGFCIAPTDMVDLLLRHATWQPSFIGLQGQCGSPAALWVQEEMPVGWGDTYFQYVAGQAFNITSLPNGTYYIEVVANPQRVLHELSTRNDVSLRKVVLGGIAGHRTVRVPAWHGIDPEG